ncbi:MAG: hypothetical protein PHO03_00120 [Candidatus Omnitrophica bacterium]|nr:hypothetical protein [Candidatus Omnitrophota bacterium]
MEEQLKPNKLLSYLSLAGIFYFIFLCALHFATRRPLWLDEVFLLNNFQELKPLEIFGVLKYSQGFPRLYLFIIRSFSALFQFDVLALRFLPFVFMLSSFAVWLNIFKKEEGRGLGYLLFILSWCGSALMSYYAAEFKQYSAELFAAAVFTYFIIKQREHLKNEKLNLPLVLSYCLLPALILFSYTAYFFILLPAYNLLAMERKNKASITYLMIYLISALVFVFISYNSDIRHTLANRGLAAYWESYCISTASFAKFTGTFWEGLKRIYVRWFWAAKPVTYIMTLFMPAALFFTFSSGIKRFKDDGRRVVSLSAILVFLLAGLFIAGVLKIFPFTAARITLYLAPFIFYTIIKGIAMFKKRLFILYVILNLVFISTVITTSIWALSGYIKKFAIYHI